MKESENRLLELFKTLSSSDKETLLAFAEFLSSRAEDYQTPIPTPTMEPRPTDEKVVDAIKRLSRSYYMLDKSTMLHETAGLVAQHFLRGREASEVIDELERIFEQHYKALLDD